MISRTGLSAWLRVPLLLRALTWAGRNLPCWPGWPVCFLALFFAGPLSAEQASLREFGPADGLESLGVQAAAQDAEGFLWVGTQNGLYRFDGVRFRRVGTAQGLAWISALAPQGDGLWVATFDGLWWWHQGQLAAVPGPDGKPLKIVGPDALAPAANRNLWVATKDGLHRVMPTRDGGGWRVERALPEDPRRPWLQQVEDGLAALSDGTLWFACGSALCRLREGEVERFGPESGVPVARWDCLRPGSKGSLWARGGAHLLELAPGAERFVRHADAGLESDEVSAYPLAEDAQGRILTATRSAVLRWDGRRWERFGGASGLSFHVRVGALLADREGGLWLGALGAGLLQWRGYAHWETWSSGDGLPSDEVWRFLRAGPDASHPLYVGTGRGVAVLDPQARRFRPLASNASGAVDIGALAVDAKGSLWAGTWGGQVVRHGGAPAGPGRVVASLRSGDTVYGLMPDAPEGALIIGLRQLYRWQPGRAQMLAEAEVGKGDFGCACRDRDGRLWVGGSASLLSPGRGHWQRFDAGGGAVYHIACLHDGSLLVSNGEDGIHRLRLLADGFLRSNETPKLLQGRQVLGLLEDSRGWWWVNTDAGVAAFNGRHWRWLDQQAGLVWGDTSGDSLYEDVDGSIWVGTSRGASRIRAPQALFKPVRGRVSLEEVRSGEHSWPLPQGENNNVRLPWGRDVIEVPLSAPVFTMRSAMRIDYRVLGFDDRWTEAPPDAVRLAGLPPGSYRFEARVVDRDLGVESPASGFGFDIEPPWWRTSQAYAAMVVSVLLLIWLWHGWRVRRVQRHAAALEALIRQRTQELETSRQALRELGAHNILAVEEERRRVARELHDELGQQLVAMRMEMSVLKAGGDAGRPPTGEQWQALRERVDHITGSMRGLVQNLRPPALDGGLAAGLQWLGAEYERSSGNSCRVEVDADARLLEPDVRIMIFRVAQESLNNVLRHAEATSASVQLRHGPYGWDLRIEDDGVGFKTAAPSSGFGLLSMQERAQLVGGVLSIDTGPGRGTRVHLHLPERRRPDTTEST